MGEEICIGHRPAGWAGLKTGVTAVTYKCIVVIASGEAEDLRVFDAAAEFGRLSCGHLEVVPVYPDPTADLIYYGVVMHKLSKQRAIERVHASEKLIQDNLERLAREAASKHGLAYGVDGDNSIGVDQRGLSPAIALAEASVLADLVVVGGECARDFLNFSALFAQALITSRTPVLVVKEGPLRLDRIAIAWDGSDQAGRAVKAALPVLHLAEEIEIIQHIGDAPSLNLAAEPGVLERYLKRHGIEQVKATTVTGEDVAAALLSAAVRSSCGLLVAGGYGRPRLVEFALGGTTRALVNAPAAPYLLLAH